MDQTQTNFTEQEVPEDFVFWLHPWKAQPGGAVDKARLVRCSIDGERLRTDSALHTGGAPLDIPLPAVLEVDKTSNFRVPVHTVFVRTRKSQSLLTPTNPYDPTLVYHSNMDEADALVEVVSTFREGRRPALDPNPYIRQMMRKDRPRSVANLDVEWDSNVSPLAYVEKYRAQAARMAPLLARTINFVSIAVLLAAVLLLVWWLLVR